MAQSISSVGRIPVITSSVQSIGLQVTECHDASTQTLNEVGIQTDLSAVSNITKIIKDNFVCMNEWYISGS